MGKKATNFKGATSYQDIFENFKELFPEWVKSIKEWSKDGFNSVRRTILVTLKNGIQIRYGCRKENDGEWVWSANAIPSEKTKKELGFQKIPKKEGVIER